MSIKRSSADVESMYILSDSDCQPNECVRRAVAEAQAKAYDTEGGNVNNSNNNANSTNARLPRMPDLRAPPAPSKSVSVTSIPPSDGSSPLSSLPLHLLSLICRSLAGRDLLSICRCSHRLYDAATHPLVFQQDIGVRVDAWNGARLIGPSGTFKTKTKLDGAMKSHIGRQLRMIHLMADCYGYHSFIIHAVSRAQSLHGLDIVFDPSNFHKYRQVARDTSIEWMRDQQEWMSELETEYGDSLPIHRIVLFRVQKMQYGHEYGKGKGKGKRDRAGSSTGLDSDSKAAAASDRLRSHVNNDGNEHDNENDNETGNDNAVSPPSLSSLTDDVTDCLIRYANSTWARNGNRGEWQYAASQCQAKAKLHDEQPQQQQHQCQHRQRQHPHWLSGYVILPDFFAGQSNELAHRASRANFHGESRVLFCLPNPFLPLITRPSLQSLRYLCVHLHPKLLASAASCLPPALILFQATIEVVNVNGEKTTNWTLPDDLPQRMQHCKLLRTFILIHTHCQRQCDPSITQGLTLYEPDGCTSLQSLYILQDIEERLPELETIQWHVTINPARLAREYAKQYERQASVAASSAASSSSSSSSSSSASSPFRGPPRLRKLCSLLLYGWGVGRSAQKNAHTGLWQLTETEVSRATAVLGWFRESISHVRMELGDGGTNSMTHVLATPWPQSIRSSLTDLTITFREYQPCKNWLAAVCKMQLHSIRRLFIHSQSKQGLPAHDLRVLLQSMPHLTNVTLRCPSFPFHSLPPLPALTSLTAPWPYTLKHHCPSVSTSDALNTSNDGEEKKNDKMNDLMWMSRRDTVPADGNDMASELVGIKPQQLSSTFPSLTHLRVTPALPISVSAKPKVADLDVLASESGEYATVLHLAFPSLRTIYWLHHPPLSPNAIGEYSIRHRQVAEQHKAARDEARRQAQLAKEKARLWEQQIRMRVNEIQDKLRERLIRQQKQSEEKWKERMEEARKEAEEAEKLRSFILPSSFSIADRDMDVTSTSTSALASASASSSAAPLSVSSASIANPFGFTPSFHSPQSSSTAASALSSPLSLSWSSSLSTFSSTPISGLGDTSHNDGSSSSNTSCNQNPFPTPNNPFSFPSSICMPDSSSSSASFSFSFSASSSPSASASSSSSTSTSTSTCTS